MTEATLQLHGSDRVRYFAPVAFCAFLGLLCLGLALVAAAVPNLRDPLAVTVTALLGLLGCGGAGFLLLRLQLHWLRYTRVPIRSSPQVAWDAVHRAAVEAGWRIASESPGQTLRALTPGSMFHEGERVAVEFGTHEILVASICDPAVGFSLTGHERCRQHTERVRQAVQAA